MHGTEEPHPTEVPIEIAAEHGNLNVFQVMLRRGHGDQQHGIQRRANGLNSLWEFHGWDLFRGRQVPFTNMWRVLNKADSFWTRYVGRSVREAEASESSDVKSLYLIAAVRDGQSSIARLLLESGADLNYRHTKGGISGWPLLHLAASPGEEALVKVLLDYNVDVSVLDRCEHSALHQAIISGHPGTANILVKTRIDANRRRAHVWGRLGGSEVPSNSTYPVLGHPRTRPLSSPGIGGI